MLEPEEEQAGLQSDAVTLIVLAEREPVAHSCALRTLAAVHTCTPQPNTHTLKHNHHPSVENVGEKDSKSAVCKFQDLGVGGLGVGLGAAYGPGAVRT